MHPLLFVLSVAGVLFGVALIVSHGAAQVGAAFLSAGPGLGLIVLARAIQIGLAGLAWQAVTPRTPPVAPSRFVFLRFIRESINALLPVAQVGGDFVGARLLTFSGPSGGVAGASVIVDIFIQVTSQFLYTLVGFNILASYAGNSPVVRALAYGLMIAVPILTAFFFVQRAGGFRLIEKLLERVVSQRHWFRLGHIGDIDAQIRAIYANRRALLTGFSIHFGTWLFGSCEVWIALLFMGHAVSLPQALALESLGQAVRGAAFVVPGGYGIQEGGFIALCAVFGIPPQVALALSLVKRVPDFAIGLPGLLAWQGLEGHRLWKGHVQRQAGRRG